MNLVDRVSNSGSIDRLLPATALVGTGFVSPKAAGVMSLFGLMNAPLVRNLTTELLAPRKNAKARTIADLIRKQSGPAGTLGSATGIGLLPPQ